MENTLCWQCGVNPPEPPNDEWHVRYIVCNDKDEVFTLRWSKTSIVGGHWRTMDIGMGQVYTGKITAWMNFPQAFQK